MKRVSYLEYQVAKAIYRKVILISASDDEALIFIYKQNVEDGYSFR